MPTIAETLQEAERRLAETSDFPRLDAEVLLAHVLEVDRSHLRAWPERTVRPEALERYRGLLERRRRGEPVAYLTGRREFWSLPLYVTADVLIPRPETELLVELALAHLPPRPGPAVADLGTGSGAVAVAMARECPHCRIVATDVAETALAVARWNAEQLGLANIDFRHGSWFEPLAGERFDLIVSNPPYVADDDAHLRRGDLPHEPRLALAAGPEGLDALSIITAQAGAHLVAGGWLLVEHGHDQGPAVRRLLAAGGFKEVATERDLAGLDRVSLGRRP